MSCFGPQSDQQIFGGQYLLMWLELHEEILPYTQKNSQRVAFFNLVVYSLWDVGGPII